jgi:hypothetical protein
VSERRDLREAGRRHREAKLPRRRRERRRGEAQSEALRGKNTRAKRARVRAYIDERASFASEGKELASFASEGPSEAEKTRLSNRLGRT